MKVLVTGANGQLAFDVINELKRKKIDYKAIDLKDADITKEDEIKSIIRKYQPTDIIHCAAYTAVDKAEDDIDLAYNINVLGTKYISEVAKEIDSSLVYISTDYVFGGEGELFLEVNNEIKPQNVYGKTKYEGELEVQKVLSKFYIVRISWVFGVNGHNFVDTMLKLGKSNKEIKVVNDQIGSPTYTYDLAPKLIELIEKGIYGTYHMTNEGICSWSDFATEIFEQSGISCSVVGIPTSQYPTKAKRPENSRLSKTSLDEIGIERLRNWKLALKDYLLKSK